MTASQMASSYVANQEALRQRAWMNTVYTPELKEAMAKYAKSIAPDFKVSEEWKKQLGEIVASQGKAVIPRYEIPQSLLDHVQEQFRQQNATLAKIIKVHGTLPATAFKLPDGWSEKVALWREQLEAQEGALDEEVESAAERLRRLADERQRIVDCLGQCSAILEGCRLAGIPIPNPVLALFVFAYAIGWAANGLLDDAADLD